MTVEENAWIVKKVRKMCEEKGLNLHSVAVEKAPLVDGKGDVIGRGGEVLVFSISWPSKDLTNAFDPDGKCGHIRTGFWVSGEELLGNQEILQKKLSDQVMDCALDTWKIAHDVWALALKRLGLDDSEKIQAFAEESRELQREEWDRLCDQPKSAHDGEIVRVDTPDRLRIAGSGGADQGNMQLAIHLVDTDSATWPAGNLDAMGGLSPPT